MSVEIAVKNSAETIGEGPHWDDVTKTLLYVDIMANDVHRWNPVSKVDEVLHLEKSVGFIVPARKGGFIIGLGLSLAHLEWDSKKVTVLHEVDHGLNNRFNDGKCDPKGRVWAGTMGFTPKNGDYSTMPRQGSLYCLDLDGTLRHHLSNIGISNGLAWTSDAKTMYYIDSIPRNIYAFDYNIDTGDIVNQRVIINYGDGPMTETGFPDGMTIDTEGKLWVATFFSERIFRFDPETGERLQAIQFPALRMTSCCFGGVNFDELYATCCKTTNSEDERQKYPLAGSVFRVTGLGIKGTAAAIYEGNL